MKELKQVGIYMNHSTAHVMALKDDTITKSIIGSEFSHEDKEFTLSKSENLMHNKEIGFKTAYFKKISEALREQNEVLLFGPTDAKRELFNLLKEKHAYSKIKLEVKECDKMDETQMEVFVRKYFM